MNWDLTNYVLYLHTHQFLMQGPYNKNYPMLEGNSDPPKSSYILQHLSICCNLTKVTEWEITKMKVGNEMEIFIILTKYNTCQRQEEGKQLLVVYYLISISTTSLTTVSNIFMRNGTNPFRIRKQFIGTVYNNF